MLDALEWGAVLGTEKIKKHNIEVHLSPGRKYEQLDAPTPWKSAQDSNHFKV